MEGVPGCLMLGVVGLAGQTERAGAGAKGGKVIMFSGSCKQKFVHSPQYLPCSLLPPISLL